MLKTGLWKKIAAVTRSDRKLTAYNVAHQISFSFLLVWWATCQIMTGYRTRRNFSLFLSNILLVHETVITWLVTRSSLQELSGFFFLLFHRLDLDVKPLHWWRTTSRLTAQRLISFHLLHLWDAWAAIAWWASSDERIDAVNCLWTCLWCRLLKRGWTGNRADIQVMSRKLLLCGSSTPWNVNTMTTSQAISFFLSDSSWSGVNSYKRYEVSSPNPAVNAGLNLVFSNFYLLSSV